MNKKFSIIILSSFLSFGLAAQNHSIGGYNVYYGSLHNHSNVSDGKGSPAEAYAYAKNIAGLDFFSLADHSRSINATEWADIKNQSDSYNQDGVFAAFYGFEWSSGGKYGHVTVINTDDYCTTAAPENTFPGLVKWLDARPSGIAFFNHPGREDNAGKEFLHFSTPPSNQFVGMELWNKNDAFGIYYYNDGYYKNDNNKGFYDEALSLGWKPGAAGAGDNHKGTWGTANDYRLAVLAKNLTRSDILEALKARRFYSTVDKNLSLSFKINGAEMGSIINSGSYTAEIQASDSDNEKFTEIVMFDKNHNSVNTWTLDSPTVNVSFILNTTNGDYYYVKVRQTDGDEAISSPIFISDTGLK